MVDIALLFLCICAFFSLLSFYTIFVKKKDSGEKWAFYAYLKATLIILVFIAIYPALFNCPSVCVNESAEPIGLHGKIRSLYHGKDFLRQQLREVNQDLAENMSFQEYLTERWATIINFIELGYGIPLDPTSEDSKRELVIAITDYLQKKFPERVRIELEAWAYEIVNGLGDKSAYYAKNKAVRELNRTQSEIEKLHRIRSSIRDTLH